MGAKIVAAGQAVERSKLDAENRFPYRAAIP
jgi:hypothetical protein